MIAFGMLFSVQAFAQEAAQKSAEKGFFYGLEAEDLILWLLSGGVIVLFVVFLVVAGIFYSVVSRLKK